MLCAVVFFFKQKTAYEMRISDWSSDVCSSDLLNVVFGEPDHVSKTLLASPVFKKVTLTGSTAVGKLLLKRAAETLKASKIGRASCRERVCQYVSLSVVAGS